MRKPYIAGAIALLAVASPLYAQSAVQVVVSQFEHCVSQHRNLTLRQGFVGHVNEGSFVRHRLRTDFNGRLELHGFCDADCSDMDLEVVDQNGYLVVADTTDDDVPIVAFYPDPGVEYTVNAKMFSCSSNRCYYSVATFT
ncbi:hypothetical protein [Sphingomonas desiccabilis]|uniref:Uncharacterized protein n=1 Tax=Sphingomonas desiccabilis TaxID=429134 RepID=A0A4Q2ITS5_9SPHN|nr:hypothetical protein [Sphingomonas desiccabilis]MBB3911230.1 hypothetical protein [Sphingomonas desiccabilis]RXZ31975.1 hypothetical protein EO081_12360 [Sphingomonas desiccabilis]